eukprot:7825768-Karenia_brevis.AAC.1
MLLLHNLSIEHGGGDSPLLLHSVSMHVHIYSRHGWWKNLRWSNQFAVATWMVVGEPQFWSGPGGQVGAPLGHVGQN